MSIKPLPPTADAYTVPNALQIAQIQRQINALYQQANDLNVAEVLKQIESLTENQKILFEQIPAAAFTGYTAPTVRAAAWSSKVTTGHSTANHKDFTDTQRAKVKWLLDAKARAGGRTPPAAKVAGQFRAGTAQNQAKHAQAAHTQMDYLAQKLAHMLDSTKHQAPTPPAPAATSDSSVQQLVDAAAVF